MSQTVLLGIQKYMVPLTETKLVYADAYVGSMTDPPRKRSTSVRSA